MAKTDTAATTAEYYRPIEAASGDYRREDPETGEVVTTPWVLNPNEIFHASHELVQEYPHLFRPVDPAQQRPGAEQATARGGDPR